MKDYCQNKRKQRDTLVAMPGYWLDRELAKLVL